MDDDAKVEIINWEPDKIEYQIVAPGKQFLILSQIFYPKGILLLLLQLK